MPRIAKLDVPHEMVRPTPTEMSMSDAFFKKMAEIVEANLGNEQFGVEDLVREIGLSRSQVHRKLHEATGQSISQFIREIRLQRAHELLVDGAGTASEIAFSVGFGSPSYFNKCFVEQFGYTPGEAKDKASSTSAISNRKNQFQPGKGRPLIIGAVTLVVVAIIWFINENIGRSDVSVSGTKDIKKDAIAVLYFDNISGDPSQDYLSDGVTDEIISRLSMIRNLRIPGISSVKPFKTKSIPLSEIASQLNVDIILEGSVKKSGNNLRITARLIDIPNNHTLWTEVYERNYATTEIFEIQSSIATSVARRFQLMTTPGIESSRPPTQSIEAYDLFLRATSHVLTQGIGMPTSRLDLSASQLKQAIKIDPGFARAYLELAAIYNYKYLATPEGKSKKDSIRILVQTALAKDPQLVEAYIALASIVSSETNAAQFLRGNLNDSTSLLLKKAYELDQVKGLLGFGDLYSAMGNSAAAVKCYNEVGRISPGHSVALRSKAVIFGHMNLPDSSQKYLSLAEKSDPTNPGLAFDEIMNISLMMHKYVLNGNYAKFHERVVRYFQEDQQSIDYRMGMAYLFGRKFSEAEKYYKTSGYNDMDVGLILLKTGRIDSGKLVLKQGLELRNRMIERVFLFDLVRIYAALGQNKEAVSYLRKSISSGFRDLGWISNDPFIDYIKDDPQYKEVLDELLEYHNRMFKGIKDLEVEPFIVEQLWTK